MRAGLSWAIVFSALSLTAPALSTEPPPIAPAASGATAPATEGTPGVTGHGTVRRPVVLGLIAALFLFGGAVVGANDKHHPKPKSRR